MLSTCSGRVQARLPVRSDEHRRPADVVDRAGRADSTRHRQPGWTPERPPGPLRRLGFRRRVRVAAALPLDGQARDGRGPVRPRHARPRGAVALQHGRPPHAAGEPADARGRDLRVAGAERVRHRPVEEAQPRRGLDRPSAPHGPRGDRGRPRPRGDARRERRHGDDDPDPGRRERLRLVPLARRRDLRSERALRPRRAGPSPAAWGSSPSTWSSSPPRSCSASSAR